MLRLKRTSLSTSHPGDEPDVKKYWSSVATNRAKYIPVYLKIER